MKKVFIEAFKYGIVGVVNTLLTLAIIWIMRSVVGTSLVVSNATGYTIGFLNSFILNRFWTFKANDNWKKEFIKFLLAFIVCYLIQLAFVLLLEKSTGLKERYATLLGMVVYTGINFLLNKYFTFKKVNSKM
ncbi:MAG: GtrA family protein [Candidatus Azobacteroides sp.]|nr:GtrA family protein [Candidatus Azobacteroides sp.]